MILRIVIGVQGVREVIEVSFLISLLIHSSGNFFYKKKKIFPIIFLKNDFSSEC
jgi:hypothetical protein